MPSDFVLSIEQRGVVPWIEVNDCPVVFSPTPQPGSGRLKINPWVVPGRNTLRVRVDWPEGVAYAPGAGRLELQLRTLSTSGGASAGEPLAFAWPREGEQEGYPHESAMTFDAPAAPPSELWGAAKPVRWTDDDQQAVRELAARAHALFAAGDSSGLSDLFDFKALDVGRCLHMESQEAREGQRAFLEMALSRELKAEPLAPAQLDLHLIGGGRLVWITREGRQPALRAEQAKGPRVAIHLYAAPINNVWTIVR